MDPIRNELLMALPVAALGSILLKLTSVPLELRKELYRADEPIEFVWFPQTGMISLVAHLDDGLQAEVGIVGREGMLGLPLLAGVATSFNEAIVQLPGSALRMSAADFRTEIEANPPFRMLIHRYGEAHHAQVAQTAACNGRHGLEERLARWLLMAADRAEGSNLPLTQDFIAMMLGVHRPSVTVTARILQRAGLISYASGIVNVLDRSALEAASCECYATVKRRCAAVIGATGS